MNTKPRLHFAAALFGAATLAVSAMTTLLPGTARAQTAVTDPVGYLSIALPANSDTFVSIPFTRPAEFTGAVASVDNATSKITLAGTPGFTAGGFAPLGAVAPNDGHKTYYAIIGPKNVALTPTFSVTTNSTAATVSAALPADFAVGDTVTIAGTASGTSTATSYTFTVAAVSGTSVTLDRAYPGNTASALAATYNHSPSEGRFYTVTANDAGSLTVNLNGDSLSNVTAGTQVSVIPYWTFGTLFPATDAGKSFMASASLKNRGTVILIPDLAGVGTNLVSKDNYFFLNGAWRLVGTDGTAPYDDATLVPDAYFIVRNPSTAPTTLAFTPTGSVLVNRFATALNNIVAGAQDNIVALDRPTAVKLNDLGLISSGAFSASPSLKGRTDQLLVYDNSQIGINKVSSATYFYFNGGWRKVNFDVALDFGTDTIEPGTGFIIRKSATNPAVTTFWQNSRNYLN